MCPCWFDGKMQQYQVHRTAIESQFLNANERLKSEPGVVNKRKRERGEKERMWASGKSSKASKHDKSVQKPSKACSAYRLWRNFWHRVHTAETWKVKSIKESGPKADSKTLSCRIATTPAWRRLARVAHTHTQTQLCIRHSTWSLNRETSAMQ